jgi:Ca2+-binding EF-hand superfamily protein
MSALSWKLWSLALFSSSMTLPALMADEPMAKEPGPGGIFKQLDTNADGFITKDEVPEEKKTLAERLFRNADKNEDGKLSATEFESGLTKQPEPIREATPGAGPFQGRPGMAGQGPEQLWKMLDRNGTGSVKPSDLPEERRERFTKMLEIADKNKDGALSKEEFDQFAARMAPREGAPGRERPEGSTRPDGAPREGDRKPEGRPDGERPQVGPRDGDRPMPRLPDGIRPQGRPEGRPDGERPEMRREGDRPTGERPEGRPEFAPGGPRGPGGVGMFFLLDTDRDGRLSKSEIENATQVLSKLDRNGDGEITPQELMPEGRPEIRRPEGDRVEMRRPEIRRPEGDRPREGERRPEARGDGDRRPEGPRDGDKPREGDRPRDAEKPKSE